MTLTPEARLRELEERKRRRETEHEAARKAAAEAAADIERAEQEMLTELDALREDQEIRSLLGRVRERDAQGLDNEEELQELERRGVGRALVTAFLLHEEPESPPPAAHTSLEERLENVQGVPGRALYSLQDRLVQGATFAELTSIQLYQNLSAMEEEVRAGSPLTAAQFNILQTFQDTLQEKTEDPYYGNDARQAYAARANAVVESIKQHLGLRIGDTYLRQDPTGP